MNLSKYLSRSDILRAAMHLRTLSICIIGPQKAKKAETTACLCYGLCNMAQPDWQTRKQENAGPFHVAYYYWAHRQGEKYARRYFIIIQASSLSLLI